MSAITLSLNTALGSLTNMVLNLRIDPAQLGDYAKYYSMFVKEASPFARYFRIINTDAVSTYDFAVGDATANPSTFPSSTITNILSTTFPKNAEQVIELNQFRQLEVSYEHFRSKQAFGTPTMFSDFVSSITSWVENSFKLYMGSVANVFIGTLTTKGDSDTPNYNTAEQFVTLDVFASSSKMDNEANIRLIAGKIAEKVQTILDEMKDARRDYNELGYVRSTSNPIIIWNEAIVRKYLKKGLQGNTLYNTPDFNFDNTLPSRFFKVGAGSTAGDGATIRTLVEKDYTKSSNPTIHCMPGELVPNGYTCLSAETYTASDPAYPFGQSGDASEAVCVICDPDCPIILHGETSDTAFENQKAHINTAWKTWSYGTGHDQGKTFVKLFAQNSPESAGPVLVQLDTTAGLGATNSYPVITKEAEA